MGSKKKNLSILNFQICSIYSALKHSFCWDLGKRPCVEQALRRTYANALKTKPVQNNTTLSYFCRNHFPHIHHTLNCCSSSRVQLHRPHTHWANGISRQWQWWHRELWSCWNKTETLRGSISPLSVMPFSFSSLLIPRDNNRWLWANNAANLSALRLHFPPALTWSNHPMGYCQGQKSNLDVLLDKQHVCPHVQYTSWPSLPSDLITNFEFQPNPLGVISRKRKMWCILTMHLVNTVYFWQKNQEYWLTTLTWTGSLGSNEMY